MYRHLLLLVLVVIHTHAVVQCRERFDVDRCQRSPSCAWMEVSVCPTPRSCAMFMYGCRPQGFCNFVFGNTMQRKAQCLQHATTCAWQYGRCNPRTSSPTARPTTTVEYEYEYEYE